MLSKAKVHTRASLPGLVLLVQVLLPLLVVSGCSTLGIADRGRTAPPEPGEVVLRWNADAGFAGFNVYRTQPNGLEIKRNSALIKPQAPASSGFVPYEFVDRGLIAGKEYYYLLEEVDSNGNAKMWETPQKAVATPLS